MVGARHHHAYCSMLVYEILIFHRRNTLRPKQFPSTMEATNSQKKALWQRSIARRTEAYLDDAVKHATARSALLRGEPQRGVAKFHRNEIRVGQLLGQGAFSEVYPILGLKLRVKQRKESVVNLEDEESKKFLHERVGEPSGHGQYVIKHLRRDLANHRSRFHHAASNLLVEAKFLARLEHPNIIKIRGWAAGETSSYGDGLYDGFFMILDRVDQTLSERIDTLRSELADDSKSLSGTMLHGDNEMMRYAMQVASALDYMHDQCIIYRDLKPDNIGLKRSADLSNSVRLFDFGLCREIPHQDQLRIEELFKLTRVGTRRYMSPEVFLGKPYNLKADVYSFSIVLHELISLETPYRMYNAALHEMMVCHEGMRPRIPSWWPDELQVLLETGWAANPRERHSIKQVCLCLKEFISFEEDPVEVVSTESSEPSHRFHMIDSSMKQIYSPEPTSTTQSSSGWGSLDSLD
jgi:serine/threonine protein kinase